MISIQIPHPGFHPDLGVVLPWVISRMVDLRARRDHLCLRGAAPLLMYQGDRRMFSGQDTLLSLPPLPRHSVVFYLLHGGDMVPGPQVSLRSDHTTL